MLRRSRIVKDDPYLKVKLVVDAPEEEGVDEEESEQQATGHCNRTQDPEWAAMYANNAKAPNAHVLKFAYQPPADGRRRLRLFAEVWDRETTKDKMMCELAAPLDISACVHDAARVGTDVAFVGLPLVRRSGQRKAAGKASGTLTLRVRYAPPAPELPPPKPKPKAKAKPKAPATVEATKAKAVVDSPGKEPTGSPDDKGAVRRRREEFSRKLAALRAAKLAVIAARRPKKEMTPEEIAESHKAFARAARAANAAAAMARRRRAETFDETRRATQEADAAALTRRARRAARRRRNKALRVIYGKHWCKMRKFPRAWNAPEPPQKPKPTWTPKAPEEPEPAPPAPVPLGRDAAGQRRLVGHVSLGGCCLLPARGRGALVAAARGVAFAPPAVDVDDNVDIHVDCRCRRTHQHELLK